MERPRERGISNRCMGGLGAVGLEVDVFSSPPVTFNVRRIQLVHLFSEPFQ